MKWLAAMLLCLAGMFLPQTSWSKGTVFALVLQNKSVVYLQEWEADSLKTVSEWKLDPTLVKYLDQAVYVDAKERMAIIRVNKDKKPHLLIIDLKSGAQTVAPDLQVWSPITYRFVKRQLEALLPMPIYKGVDSHWQIWRLTGQKWHEARNLRTKHIDELVPGHRWLGLATAAVDIVEPTGLQFSFGVCGNGGGRLEQESIFGAGPVFGAIDVISERALVLLMDEEGKLQIGLVDIHLGGLMVVSRSTSVNPSTMTLLNDTIVIASGDGMAASLDFTGRTKAERSIQAQLACMIG